MYLGYKVSGGTPYIQSLFLESLERLLGKQFRWMLTLKYLSSFHCFNMESLTLDTRSNFNQL